MTLIVAWRDPFCMVSDDAETGLFGGKSSTGSKKIRSISDTLAIGLAGHGSSFEEVVKRVRGVLPAASWRSLEMKTQAIIDDINHRTDVHERWVTVVIAGTVGGERDSFDSGPEAARRAGGTALGQPYVFAGSGGVHASAARAIASRWRRKVTGEKLLAMIAEVAAETDYFTEKPFWRIDLVDGVTEPKIWLQ
jgi:hypothetical protein